VSRKAGRWVAAAVIVLSLPGALLLLIFLAASFTNWNPMGMAFKTRFTVYNKTLQDLAVTPIGAVGIDDERYTLPLLRDTEGYVREHKTSHFLLPSHGSVTFLYDWDDINLSELIVHLPGGDRVLVLDPQPTENQYHPPLSERFEIRDVSELAPAEPKHAAALDRRETIRPFWLYIYASVPGMALASLWLWRDRSRVRRVCNREHG